MEQCIKLSEWAKKHNYSYRGAFNLFKKGLIEKSFQTSTGSIFVEIPVKDDSTENSSDNYSEEFISSEMEKIKNDCIYFIENYCFLMSPVQGIDVTKLYDFQKTLIESYVKDKHVIVGATRQCGKTTINGLYSLWKAIITPNTNILFVVSSEISRSILMEKFNKIMQHLPSWLLNVLSHDRYSINFKNGSSISVTNLNVNHIRGTSYDIAIFEEMDFLKSDDTLDFWRALLPALSNNETRKIIASSSESKNPNILFRNFIHNGRSKSYNFTYHTIPWNVVPGRDQKWKEEMINLLGNEDDFNMEFEAEF